MKKLAVSMAVLVAVSSLLTATASAAMGGVYTYTLTSFTDSITDTQVSYLNTMITSATYDDTEAVLSDETAEVTDEHDGIALISLEPDETVAPVEDDTATPAVYETTDSAFNTGVIIGALLALPAAIVFLIVILVRSKKQKKAQAEAPQAEIPPASFPEDITPSQNDKDPWD